LIQYKILLTASIAITSVKQFLKNETNKLYFCISNV